MKVHTLTVKGKLTTKMPKLPAEWQDDPDRVLSRRFGETRDSGLLHTIPFRHLEPIGTHVDIGPGGCGVLVSIGQRYFILTAGHCLSQFPGQGLVTALPHRDTYELVVRKRGYINRPKSNWDIGYIELDDACALEISTLGRSFLPPQRVIVRTGDELRAADDWMLVCGYPDSLQELHENRDGVLTLPFLFTTSIPIGRKSFAVPLDPPDQEPEYFYLWVPRKSSLLISDQPYEAYTAPKLDGASGSGGWKSNARPTPEEWMPEKVQLAGIFIGYTPVPIRQDGDEHTFLLYLCVGHHLRMIYDDYPELREEMTDAWPELKSWPGHPGAIQSS